MWIKVDDSTYERPFGESELLVWLIGASKYGHGCSEWHLTLSAKLVSKDATQQPLNAATIARLRSAWKALRFACPNIATFVKEPGKTLGYRIPQTAADVEAWLAQTFHEETDVESVERLMRRQAPNEMLHLHVLARTGEILMETGHWFTDGRGIILLLNRFFDLAGLTPSHMEQAWGEEITRLTPSQEDLFNLPYHLDDTDFAFVDIKAKEALKTTPVMTIPSLGDEKAPSDARRTLVRLNVAETRAIVNVCKERNVSVTSAVHAALALVNMTYSDESTRAFPYRSSFRRDCRYLLPEKYRTTFSGMCHVALPTDIPYGTTFDDCLALLNPEYRRGVTDQIFRIRRVYNQHIINLLFSPGHEAAGRICDVDISSLGVLDRFLKSDVTLALGADKRESADLQIRDITCSPAMYSSQSCLMVWTLHGELHLLTTWNDAYHTEAEISEITTSVKDTLVRHLSR